MRLLKEWGQSKYPVVFDSLGRRLKVLMPALCAGSWEIL